MGSPSKTPRCGCSGSSRTTGSRCAATELEALAQVATATAPSVKREPKHQGRVLHFEELEPWPDPVDGAVWVQNVATLVTKYLAVPKHADMAIALWVLHAYALEASFTAPYLAITSPTETLR